jgi:hypothetical protein
VSVQYSETPFQVASVELCNELLPSESEWRKLHCGPGGGPEQRGCWLFIDFEDIDSNCPASAIILQAIRFSDQYQTGSSGPFEPRADAWSIPHFEEFVLDREERRWVENPNPTDGSSGAWGIERYETLKNSDYNIVISSPFWYYHNSDVLVDWDDNPDMSYSKMSTNFCQMLFFSEQAPFSCETVKTSHPTYLEAASVAYTTAGIIASVLIPVTAFIAGVMNGKKVADVVIVAASNEL